MCLLQSAYPLSIADHWRGQGCYKHVYTDLLHAVLSVNVETHPQVELLLYIVTHCWLLEESSHCS